MEEKQTTPKESKPDIRCNNCGNIFRGVITEDTKCPKCGATEGLSKWSGGVIIG